MVAATATSQPDTPPPGSTGGTRVPQSPPLSASANGLASIDSILTDLAAPDASLASVAVKHSISVADLCLWLTRPDIRERMLTIESGACTHVRLTASLNLTRAVHALQTTLVSYIELSKRLEPTDPVLIRASIHARKASWLLLQLARLAPITEEHLARARRVIGDTPSPQARTHAEEHAVANRADARASSPRAQTPHDAPQVRAPQPGGEPHPPAQPVQESARESDPSADAPETTPAAAARPRATPTESPAPLSSLTRSTRPARPNASRRPADLIRAAATTPVPLGSSP